MHPRCTIKVVRHHIMKIWRHHNVSIHRYFYQNRLINECVSIKKVLLRSDFKQIIYQRKFLFSNKSDLQ